MSIEIVATNDVAKTEVKVKADKPLIPVGADVFDVVEAIDPSVKELISWQLVNNITRSLIFWSSVVGRSDRLLANVGGIDAFNDSENEFDEIDASRESMSDHGIEQPMTPHERMHAWFSVWAWLSDVGFETRPLSQGYAEFRDYRKEQLMSELSELKLRALADASGEDYEAIAKDRRTSVGNEYAELKANLHAGLAAVNSINPVNVGNLELDDRFKADLAEAFTRAWTGTRKSMSKRSQSSTEELLGNLALMKLEQQAMAV